MTKENKQSLLHLLNKLDIKKSFDYLTDKEEYKLKMLNEEAKLILNKYSKKYLEQILLITNSINNVDIEVNIPKYNIIKISDIISLALDYYKEYDMMDYLVLKDKFNSFGTNILNDETIKKMKKDPTINSVPIVVHQFRHIIENDFKSQNYNVLSNTLAIFNEINFIDIISDNNPNYKFLKVKRISFLKEISITLNSYINMILKEETINKNVIYKYFPFLKSEDSYNLLLNELYDLNSFDFNIRNIISTLKAIDLALAFQEFGKSDITLELDSIKKTYKNEELSINNSQVLNRLGSNLEYLLENIDKYESYVNSLSSKTKY